MKTIIDKDSGKVLFATLDDNYQVSEKEIMVDKLLTENFLIPLWNFTTEEFYEGATEEEIQAKEIDIIAERKRMQHAELLETDWYVVRFAETGVPIPQEIIDLRNQIRNKYESN
jgi:hypothetical protein